MTKLRSLIASLILRAKYFAQSRRAPLAPEPRGKAGSLIIGPANSAGQGYRWARALEALETDISVTSMQFLREQSSFRFPTDQGVPSGVGAYSKRWQKKQLQRVKGYDAALIESGSPLFGRLLDGDTAEQIRTLSSAKVKVGLIFRGSDLRNPEKHLVEEEHSHFGVDNAFTLRMNETSQRNRQLVARVGCKVFVSTPDLIREVPGATWLPVVIDPELWATTSAPLNNSLERPRVVHIPSSSFVKGTELIHDQLKALADDGTIEYVCKRNVPHKDMPDLYRSADIVIDQMRAGIYGVAACEAMAAGRIVVSHVSERVRDKVLELTGTELPIIEATPESIQQVLRDIIESPRPHLERAYSGKSFVRAWHDGRVSGQVLATWLEGNR